MKVFKLKPDVENFKWVIYISYDDHTYIDKWLGKRMVDIWKPLQLKYIKDRKQKNGDFPNFTSGLPVLSENAVKVLEPLIRDDVEFLSVTIKNEKSNFFLMNVIKTLDCLDFEKSTIIKFDSGRIMDIKKHFFIDEKIGDAIIFRLNEHEREIFITQKFVDVVESSNLKGFDFEEMPEKYDNVFSHILMKNKK